MVGDIFGYAYKLHNVSRLLISRLPSRLYDIGLVRWIFVSRISTFIFIGRLAVLVILKF